MHTDATCVANHLRLQPVYVQHCSLAYSQSLLHLSVVDLMRRSQAYSRLKSSSCWLIQGYLIMSPLRFFDNGC